MKLISQLLISTWLLIFAVEFSQAGQINLTHFRSYFNELGNSIWMESKSVMYPGTAESFLEGIHHLPSAGTRSAAS